MESREVRERDWTEADRELLRNIRLTQRPEDRERELERKEEWTEEEEKFMIQRGEVYKREQAALRRSMEEVWKNIEKRREMLRRWARENRNK